MGCLGSKRQHESEPLLPSPKKKTIPAAASTELPANAQPVVPSGASDQNHHSSVHQDVSPSPPLPDAAARPDGTSSLTRLSPSRDHSREPSGSTQVTSSDMTTPAAMAAVLEPADEGKSPTSKRKRLRVSLGAIFKNDGNDGPGADGEKKDEKDKDKEKEKKGGLTSPRKMLQSISDKIKRKKKSPSHDTAIEEEGEGAAIGLEDEDGASEETQSDPPSLEPPKSTPVGKRNLDLSTGSFGAEYFDEQKTRQETVQEQEALQQVEGDDKRKGSIGRMFKHKLKSLTPMKKDDEKEKEKDKEKERTPLKREKSIDKAVSFAPTGDLTSTPSSSLILPAAGEAAATSSSTGSPSHSRRKSTGASASSSSPAGSRSVSRQTTLTPTSTTSSAPALPPLSRTSSSTADSAPDLGSAPLSPRRQELRDVLARNQVALQERGEKLDRLDANTSLLEHGASSFRSAAHDLLEQLKK